MAGSLTAWFFKCMDSPCTLVFRVPRGVSMSRKKAGLPVWLGMLVAIAFSVVSPGLLAAEEEVNSNTLASGAEVVLNGIGEARELTGSVYLGALYLEHRSNNPDVVVTSIWSKRLSMRVSADKVYGRRLGQMWRERIAINSDRKLVTDLGKEIMQFVDTFKQTYLKGDQIDIDFTPEKGTTISVNGTTIGRIKRPELYELLLRAWVGEKPPTAQFKVGVMGNADDVTAIALQHQFATLKPTPKRVAETNGWALRNELANGS